MCSHMLHAARATICQKKLIMKSLYTSPLCVPNTKYQIPNTSPDIWFQINVNICASVFIPEPFPSSPLCAPPGTPFCSRSTPGRTWRAPPLFVCSTQPGSKMAVKTSYIQDVNLDPPSRVSDRGSLHQLANHDHGWDTWETIVTLQSGVRISSSH